ncbi:MAG TPA: YsnF/AvaK domain-containing protein [Streptomyces sp.]|nr:YsnF/AvaK domain-containing protein [Streptomyces sp.]
MITKEQIPEVLDHQVHDAEGRRIGEAGHVFLDDVTGQPEWATVRTGLFGTHETFVPIHDATLVEDHLEVPYSKDQVKDAPHVDVDQGGHLSEEEERRLYQYYGVDIDWGTAQQEAAPAAEARDRTEAGRRDEAMTRSEEEMRVGVERRESGRARLRKYVVTEDVQRTVPVRHEEVRVEREPITEENVDEAMRGPEISEAEHEVTLHEERPVVETEVRPVERVRLTTDERTEQETVEGKVRKERIEEVEEDVEDEKRRRR